MFICIFKGHAFCSLALGRRGACRSALQRGSQFPRSTKANVKFLGMLRLKKNRQVRWL